MFEAIARPAVADALGGINGTVFVSWLPSLICAHLGYQGAAALSYQGPTCGRPPSLPA